MICKVSRRSIICLSLGLRENLLATDKSQCFAQPHPIIVNYYFVTSWLYLSRRYIHLNFDVHTINRCMPILMSLKNHPITLWGIQIINCDDNYYMRPPDPICEGLKNCNIILTWKVTTTQTYTLVLSTFGLRLDCTGYLMTFSQNWAYFSKLSFAFVDVNLLGPAVQSLICGRGNDNVLKKTIEINMPWTDDNKLLKVWFPFIWS